MKTVAQAAQEFDADNGDVLQYLNDYNRERLAEAIGAMIHADREEWRRAIAKAEQRELAALAELDEARAMLRKRHGMECPTYDDSKQRCYGCEVSEFLGDEPLKGDAT